MRAQARETRGFLGVYAPDNSPALRGHLYAIEGYAEIFLADRFCSGIPLSTVDFDGDFTIARGNDMYFPAKYPTTGSVTLVLANGVEARLIESEAALRGGSPEWLAKLNALRTDGTYDTQSNPDGPSQTDTLWHAGSGGVAGLRPLDDPGAATTRVDLLFRERAFWLYLTGHWQGDLRRLIRQYGRAPNSVYPTGAYLGAGGTYGTEIVAPVPPSERDLNPKYTGCVHHDA